MNTLKFLEAHWAQLGVLFGVVGTPFVAHMPSQFPRSVDAWWGWLRDSLQQMVNSRAANAPKQ